MRRNNLVVLAACLVLASGTKNKRYSEEYQEALYALKAKDDTPSPL